MKTSALIYKGSRVFRISKNNVELYIVISEFAFGEKTFCCNIVTYNN